MVNNFDQAFRFKLAKGFTQGDAADIEFRSDGVLAQLFAFAKFAAQNLVSQSICDGRSQRLAWNGLLGTQASVAVLAVLALWQLWQ